MHYIVDGYNLLFRLEAFVPPLKKARDEILSLLAEEIHTLRLNMTVVFDSNHEESELFPSRQFFQGMEIIFTPKNQSADEHILEMLEWKKNPKNEKVITSDSGLAKQVKALGARAEKVEDFLKWLLKKKRKTHVEKKEMKETPRNVERLLKIFEKRLKDEG